MIHVSQLKRALPLHTIVSDDSDLQLLTTLLSMPPSQVLATRLQLVGRKAVPTALVQRRDCPSHWAT